MGNVFPQDGVESGLPASALDFLNADAGGVPDDFDDAFSAEDDGFGMELQAMAASGNRQPAKSVKGNWLDAFQRENMDDHTVETGYVTAVNSDETGLYRLFRNLSP